MELMYHDSKMRRITAYINSLDRGNGSLCDEVEEEAVSSYVPIIRKETSALLKTLCCDEAAGENTGSGYGGRLFRSFNEPCNAGKLSYNDNRKIRKAYSDSKRKFYKGRGRGADHLTGR